MPQGGFPSYGPSSFQWALSRRLWLLSHELVRVQEEQGIATPRTFCMPIGLFLVLDEANGGDKTAQELLRRFEMLSKESEEAIDFFFLGWHRDRHAEHSTIKFNVDGFLESKKMLAQLGIKAFGGNCDLILVNAQCTIPASDPTLDTQNGFEVILRFDQAIHINLAQEIADKNLPSLGEFLSMLVVQAKDVADDRFLDPTGEISDRLGVVFAKRAILDFIWEKLGKVIGAKSLSTIATRGIGCVAKIEDCPIQTAGIGSTARLSSF
jgi:hypothetical protein